MRCPIDGGAAAISPVWLQNRTKTVSTEGGGGGEGGEGIGSRVSRPRDQRISSGHSGPRGRTAHAKGSSLEECQVLQELYDATGGPQWHIQDGWNDRAKLLTDCCNAYGVQCAAEDGTVLSLLLLGNNLRGPIPSSISRLRNLTEM